MRKAFRLLQIVGARPQILKSAALTRAWSKRSPDSFKLLTLHTGQHYSHELSASFYDELDIPRPEENLGIGSASHGEQTAMMMESIAEYLSRTKPHGVIVYGDTNSTLAGSLAASRMGLPVFHIEAGLRSGNLNMPEEVNRIATDHLSTLLFCPTEEAMGNLMSEGIPNSPRSVGEDVPMIYFTGDVMCDNLIHFKQKAEIPKEIQGLVSDEQGFILVTCHRPANTDNESVFRKILAALKRLCGQGNRVIFPCHPRVSSMYTELIEESKGIDGLHIISPVGYLEMIWLISRAEVVMTDSGGMQKESFMLERPCVVLRDDTEWVELLDGGHVLLTKRNPDAILQAVDRAKRNNLDYPAMYGDGNAAEIILEHIMMYLARC